MKKQTHSRNTEAAVDEGGERVSTYMTRAVPTAKVTDTVADLLNALAGNRFESMHSVYVINDDHALVGAVTFGDLFVSDPKVALGALMQANPPSVREDVDREDAASLAIKESLADVPVVDRQGRFVGVFPPRAIMGVLREEHLEDLHHMTGIWHHTDSAREALQASPLKRARYRLPWLVVGLAGSMLAMTLVARFTHVLQAQIELAFFIPAIVYLADAVGTQSEAVAVRGLSLTNAGIGRLLTGEIATGALMGLMLAVFAGAFTVLWFDRFDLALVVGTSLFGACTIATGIGLGLPWVFSQTGGDPALASGPIGTIIQDLLSLMIFFLAASALL